MDTHELADLAFKMLMTKELRDPVPEGHATANKGAQRELVAYDPSKIRAIAMVYAVEEAEDAVKVTVNLKTTLVGDPGILAYLLSAGMRGLMEKHNSGFDDVTIEEPTADTSVDVNLWSMCEDCGVRHPTEEMVQAMSPAEVEKVPSQVKDSVLRTKH